MKDSWFFPDSYLREMEALVAAIYQVEGKAKDPDIKDVLLMAQAFGVYMRGAVDKAGGLQPYLKGIRKEGGPQLGRTELPNKRYFQFLRFVSQIDDVNETQPAPTPVIEEKPELSTADVWSSLQDAYKEHAPSEWPQLTRRLPLAKLATRMEEGVSYAGSPEEFVAMFSSALSKVPDFYRTTYVRKGAKIRPVSDCILCLLSGDKHHKELGVAGWRMFEWSDLMDAGEAPKPGIKHPSEEFLYWSGTRWTYRRPELDDAILEEHRLILIAAGLGPADS